MESGGNKEESVNIYKQKDRMNVKERKRLKRLKKTVNGKGD